MATKLQTNQTLQSLKEYKRKYVKKQFADLDESATRIMINAFLTDVLGFLELDDIKTEYNIRGQYADYVIQLARKKQIVVEVKAAQLDLSEKHLRQSTSYAANEGIDWIILTNGRTFQIYRVIFNKPIRTELLADINLHEASPKQLTAYAEVIALFTKRGLLKNEPESFWLKCVALSPKNISKILYSEDVVRLIRREIKKKNNINLDHDAVKDALIYTLGKKIDTDNYRFKDQK